MLIKTEKDVTTKLRVDWATYQSTVYACKNWHYSRTVPAGKLVKVGVWENDIFKGVVLFSRGANNNIGRPYKLNQFQCCELTRVALAKHSTSVTRIVSLAIKLLKKLCPDIKLIISYADADRGHVGSIYQAGNWLYEGHLHKDENSPSLITKGKVIHGRTVTSKYGALGKDRLGWIQKNIDPNARPFFTKGKHKYLYALDEQTKQSILHLSKPYPKK